MLKITFPSSITVSSNGSFNIQLGYHDGDSYNTNFNLSNDWSFINSTNYVTAPNTVIKEVSTNSIVYGTAPTGVYNSGTTTATGTTIGDVRNSVNYTGTVQSSEPVIGDLFFDISSDMYKLYTGSQWETLSNLAENVNINGSVEDPDNLITVNSPYFSLQSQGDLYNYSGISLWDNDNNYKWSLLHKKTVGSTDNIFQIEEFNGSEYKPRVELYPNGKMLIYSVLQMYDDYGIRFGGKGELNVNSSGELTWNGDAIATQEQKEVLIKAVEPTLRFVRSTEPQKESIIRYDEDGNALEFRINGTVGNVTEDAVAMKIYDNRQVYFKDGNVKIGQDGLKDSGDNLIYKNKKIAYQYDNVLVSDEEPWVKLSRINDRYSSYIFYEDGANDENEKGLQFRVGVPYNETDLTNYTRMTILDNGNVGIGTNKPTEKLEVNGTIKTNNFTVSANEPRIKFTKENVTNGSTTNNLNAAIHYERQGTSPGLEFRVGYKDTENSSDFIAMKIRDDGMVEVGQDNNSTAYKMVVNGKFGAREIVVTEDNWADYVFGNDYKLMKLQDVEKYIKDNKHLPNMPSAKEIKKDGLSMGDMQRRMMEKIEELTLYVIEQDKKNKTQEKRIAELEMMNRNN